MNKPNTSKKLTIIIATCTLLVILVTVSVLLLCGVFSPEDEPEIDETTEDVTADEPTTPDNFKILSVEPTKIENGFMASNSGFFVRAENGNADTVRRHIFISSASEYTVSERAEGEYEVAVSGKFECGKTVSVKYIQDGVTLNSWAFDTETKLEVSNHYPYKDSYGVELNSVIEIEMSLLPDQSIENYVNIFPKTNGKWEQSGKIFRFIPETYFAEKTDYTVTVSPGMTANALKMEGEYQFTFHTYTQYYNYESTPSLTTYDGINYYRPGEQITIAYDSSSNVAPNKTELYKFASVDDIVAYASGKKDTEKTFISNVPFTAKLTKNDFGPSRINITLEPQQTGYYCANVCLDNGRSFEWLIQVNPINAYACVTGSDILVWTESSDVNVKYKNISAETDSNGIAILKDAIGKHDALGHLYVGEGNYPLTIGIKDIEDQTYPQCYLYTDKPKYKTSDTVRVWGCIPEGLFYGTEPSFSVKLEINANTVKTITVTPDENGTFTADIPYENVEVCEWANVELHADGRSVAWRSIEVDDYELQNYIFTFSADTNYVWGGENYVFDILVEHISGVVVQDKLVRVNYNGKDYFATSDSAGIAHFSIHIPKLAGDEFQQEIRYRRIIESRYLYIYNGDVEEQAAEESILTQSFYLIKYDKNVWKTIEAGRTTVTYQTRSINTNGIDKVELDPDSYDRYNIESGHFETSGRISVRLYTYTRTREGESFDPYTNTYVPKYSKTVKSSSLLDSIYFETKDGKHTHDFSGYILPESTEFVYYSIEAEVVIDIKNGWNIYSTEYLGSNYYKTASVSDGSNAPTFIRDYDYRTPLTSSDYNTYDYQLSVSSNEVDIGEKVELKVQNHKNENVKDGQILRVIFTDSIMDAQVFSGDRDISFVFTEAHLPTVSVNCAYYKDGRFWRMPRQNISANVEARKVLIETVTDAQTYAPGDKATVNIKTTDADGKPISATVNLSIVNEAVFCGETEYLDIGYQMISYNTGLSYLYTFSTYRNYNYLTQEEGGKGGENEMPMRKNFVDTAYFESVVTDASGNATVTFTLPDSITTYRMTSHAASGKYYYGTHVDTLSVKSEFFLQSSAPVGLKDADDFVANANTISEASGTVSYIFEIIETNSKQEAVAKANSNVSVNFGKLPIGKYTLAITATMGDYKDAIEYPFEVIAGSLTAPVTDKVDTSSVTTIQPTSFPVKLDVYTVSTEKYLEYLNYLQTNDTDRRDKIIASHVSYKLQSDLLGVNFPDSIIVDNYSFMNNNNISTMFVNGSPDYILTAFDIYYGTRSNYVDQRALSSAKTPREAAERLLLDSANGKSVIFNLKSLEPHVGDDHYTRIIIALSYCFAGDYQNAERVYRECNADVSDRGYRALYATVATYVDKSASQALIDKLLIENEGEYYLPFAVMSFIGNRAVYESGERHVTVTVNGTKQELNLHWLEVKTLVFYDDGSGKLDISFTGAKAAARVHYTDIDKNTASGSFSVILQDCNKKYGTAVLEIDLGAFTGSQNKIDIVLPPCLRASAARNLQGNAYLSAKREKLTVYTYKNTSSTIRIPLIITNEGNYMLESVRLTDKNGSIHYSDPIEINISK